MPDYQNQTNLLVGLNFEDAAHNPELVMNPVEMGQFGNNLVGQRIDSIVTANNVGEQFNAEYTPHGGGPGYVIPDNDAALVITINGDLIRVAKGPTNLAYQRR